MSWTERLSTLGMPRQATPKQLRSFGLLVGGVFCLIGSWPMIVRGQGVRPWALVIGGGLLALGSVAPGSLGLVYRVWMLAGHVLGWVNTRILLGAIFYTVITPMAVVMRLRGRDAMRRGFDRNAQTYRVWRSPRPHDHMARQF